jgi:hypothetical protein
MKRWRGLKALVQAAVENGSIVVERVHKETANRPFAILEAIPVIAEPTKVVHAIHDASVTITHEIVRGVTRVVGAGVDAAIDVAEKSQPESKSDE